MAELAQVVDAGHEATILFLVNRGDCDRFEVARDIDPGYGQAFDAAVAAGVNVLPLAADVDPSGWNILSPIPIASI
jgi:sugar fermentation stimulation protein A